MRLLFSLFVAGVASSVWAVANEAAFLRGNGKCSIPGIGADTCSLTYLWDGDSQFKLTIAIGKADPTVVSGVLKVDMDSVTVYDELGNRGSSEFDGKRLTLNFPLVFEGLVMGAVSLSEEIHHADGRFGFEVEFLDLSGSVKFPWASLNFKGRLEIDPQITACLVAGKKPADCGV